MTCAACEQQGIVPKATAIGKRSAKQSCNFDSQGLRTSKRYRTPSCRVCRRVCSVRGTVVRRCFTGVQFLSLVMLLMDPPGGSDLPLISHEGNACHRSCHNAYGRNDRLVCFLGCEAAQTQSIMLQWYTFALTCSIYKCIKAEICIDKDKCS